jgi:hypothetical protein
MGPLPSNTDRLNVALVTVRILALDRTPSDVRWWAAGAPSIVKPPDGFVVKCLLALTGMPIARHPSFQSQIV